jgi:hypothetical protein
VTPRDRKQRCPTWLDGPRAPAWDPLESPAVRSRVGTRRRGSRSPDATTVSTREGTPVTSGASAADSVRRESAWHRAGPPGGSDPVEHPASRPWFARDGADAGPPRRTSFRAKRRTPWGTDRVDGPSGRPSREPSRRASLPTPKPQERDRMKHAGRLWRGATRQGRVKRRRRTEASVGARDEEPGPFGTCTAVLLLGRGQRAVIRLPAPVAPNLGSMRAARGAGGRPEHDHPRSGKAWGPTVAERRRAPRGVTELRRQKTSHRTGCLVDQGRSPRASPAPHPRVRNRTGSPPARWTGPRSRKPREHRPRDGRDLGPGSRVSTARETDGISVPLET